ncbi:Galactoside 2-alpha-L-fucosyltransferase [Hordeum vulgare]|nr:Galactoside 2-alpha-L-fucosyltransferase [Hordeum vulgare]
MNTPDPALVTVDVEVAKSMAGGAAVDLPAGHLRAASEASSNAVPRKRLGNIIVQGGAPVPAATVAATKGVGRPKARPPTRYRVANNIGEIEAAEAAKKKVVLKRKRAPPSNRAPASSTPATAAVPPVFVGMPERYVRPNCVFFFAAVGVFRSRIRRLFSRSEYAVILEENTENIEDAPLGDYGYNGMDDGVHGGGEEEEEEEEELQEIGGIFEASQSTIGYSKRKKGYTQLEDEVLIRLWKVVSLDAIHGTDQTGKRFWQRIEDKFFRLMPNNVDKTPGTYRSLQGRWDVIRRLAGGVDSWSKSTMLLQVEPMKPIGEKWKVRDKEALPKKGAFTLLDDEDDNEEERNKGRPDGTKKAKYNMRKDSEASSLREKIDHMVKSDELMVTMTIEAKKVGNEEVSRERG